MTIFRKYPLTGSAKTLTWILSGCMVFLLCAQARKGFAKSPMDTSVHVTCQKERIELHASNASLPDIVTALSDTTGVPIHVLAPLSGSVTIHLQGRTLGETLQALVPGWALVHTPEAKAPSLNRVEAYVLPAGNSFSQPSVPGDFQRAQANGPLPDFLPAHSSSEKSSDYCDNRR